MIEFSFGQHKTKAEDFETFYNNLTRQYLRLVEEYPAPKVHVRACQRYIMMMDAMEEIFTNSVQENIYFMPLPGGLDHISDTPIIARKYIASVTTHYAADFSKEFCKIEFTKKFAQLLSENSRLFLYTIEMSSPLTKEENILQFGIRGCIIK